jgi:hypothetical protein
MKRFYTATVLLLSAVAFAFFTCGQASAQDQKETGPVFKFDDTKWNFGMVRESELVHMEFKFTNTGTEPIIITEVKTSCGCTKVDYPKTPIKPGEKGVIKVNFDTTGKLDRQDRTVDVISNAKGGPHQLRFKGVVLKKKGK